MAERFEILKTLIDAYVRLNELNASSGERAHTLAYSMQFIEKQIKLLITKSNAQNEK